MKTNKKHFVLKVAALCCGLFAGCVEKGFVDSAGGEQEGLYCNTVWTTKEKLLSYNWNDEIPKLSLAKASELAAEALGTNASAFFLTRAYSKVSQSGGGWEFVFNSQTVAARYHVHIGENEHVLACFKEEYDPVSKPTLLLQESIETANTKRPFVLTRACLDDINDTWLLYGLEEGKLNKEIFFY